LLELRVEPEAEHHGSVQVPEVSCSVELLSERRMEDPQIRHQIGSKKLTAEPGNCRQRALSKPANSKLSGGAFQGLQKEMILDSLTQVLSGRAASECESAIYSNMMFSGPAWECLRFIYEARA
jgi:hypothetical protein